MSFLIGGLAGRCGGAEPRARAVEFEARTIYHSPENPGYAAWVQLWPDGDRLMIKFLERRHPPAGVTLSRPPLDVHQWEAIGLPAKYDFAALVNQVIYMVSKDGAATWHEDFRGPASESNLGNDSVGLSPVALPDGRLLDLTWGMPGYLRQSTDGGRNWRPLREIMDPAYYDVSPFSMRLLRDGKTLVIFCPYAHAWGPGKEFPGRLHSKPGVKGAWQAALFFSTDMGKTLTGPIPIYPGVPVTETDFCQLPSGDLLFIHAGLFDGGKAHRQLIRKSRDGWVPEEMQEVDSRAPETFVRTSEGYLVGASRNAPYVWSEDDGLTWQPVEDIPGGQYQPRAMLLKDNRVLFVWHKGGDLPYGQADMYIGQHTFKLKVDQPRTRSRLTLSRVYDAKLGKYVCAFDALLTTIEGKPIEGKTIEFSIVARDAPGYAPFGGGMPWVHGAKQIVTTDAAGIARVSYPEQQAITNIHQTYQIAARFDPDHSDPQYLPSTSLTVEYYAVTPSAHTQDRH